MFLWSTDDCNLIGVVDLDGLVLWSYYNLFGVVGWDGFGDYGGGSVWFLDL